MRVCVCVCVIYGLHLSRGFHHIGYISSLALKTGLPGAKTTDGSPPFNLGGKATTWDK